MPKEEKDYRTNDNLIIGRNAVIEQKRKSGKSYLWDLQISLVCPNYLRKLD